MRNRSISILCAIFSIFSLQAESREIARGHPYSEDPDEDRPDFSGPSDEDGERVRSPQEIQQQLDESEKQLARAEKMFAPWYTGPLITPSPSMIPVGALMIQPYINTADYYAAYNNQRHSVSTPSLVNLNPLSVFQTGVTDFMDILTIVQGNINWRDGQSDGGFGDLIVSPGFLIFKQTRYVPKFKAFIQQTFPTGVYQNLNPHKGGLDALGKGAYQTQVGAIFGKLFFWQYAHPLAIRWSLGYTIPSSVQVHNFNAYGGGYGTKGTVYPAGTFATDLGIELSLSQRWVFALDVVYSYTGHTTFCGERGVDLKGHPALIGSPSNDNLSLAPAFEYNWNANLGVIAGVQFSVYGRNSGDFITGLVSVCYVLDTNE